MDALIEIIHSHVEIAPAIIFGSLLLAGFCLPISEDAVLFVSAYLASTHPEMREVFFLSTLMGIYLSDIICFGLGWFLGERLFRLRFFAKLITPSKVTKMKSFYDRYGFWTLVVGRFIPFGVRSTLFLTAGISKMQLKKFFIADLVAALVSTTVFFTLYYQFGKAIVDGVRRANLVLFGCFVVFVLVLLAVRKLRSVPQARSRF